jgi:hypothetical protein
MPYKVYSLILACASAVLASAQAPSPSTEPGSVPSSSPVAYVYVSQAVNDTQNQIHGYAVTASGALTAIPGSPFPASANYLAVNGAWLFGVESGGADNKGNIFSYSIASNGTLTQKDTFTVPSQDGQVINLFLDHTGATLYANANSGDANDFLSLSIDQMTGALTEVGDLNLGPGDEGPLSFVGNNEFAYTSFTYELQGGSFLGVQRASDGSLSSLSNLDTPLPTAKSGYGYWPGGAAADPTNHLAIAVVPTTSENGTTPAGPAQLATYTVESDGSLITSSTWENMPSVLVGNLNDYWMSPSGKYLAVGGASGLQLFRFHGAQPITRFTGLITRDPINQLFWDNSNHLYAISAQSGKLLVFTITASGAKPAPGSPHALSNPVDLIVLPK